MIYKNQNLFVTHFSNLLFEFGHFFPSFGTEREKGWGVYGILFSLFYFLFPIPHNNYHWKISVCSFNHSPRADNSDPKAKGKSPVLNFEVNLFSFSFCFFEFISDPNESEHSQTTFSLHQTLQTGLHVKIRVDLKSWVSQKWSSFSYFLIFLCKHFKPTISTVGVPFHNGNELHFWVRFVTFWAKRMFHFLFWVGVIFKHSFNRERNSVSFLHRHFECESVRSISLFFSVNSISFHLQFPKTHFRSHSITFRENCTRKMRKIDVTWTKKCESKITFEALRKPKR